MTDEPPEQLEEAADAEDVQGDDDRDDDLLDPPPLPGPDAA
jgi:hypothetical protein